MSRKQIDKIEVENAVNDAKNHLLRVLRNKGMGTISSSHEALGIVTEEYLELCEAVKKNDLINLRHELLDIATACIFTVACIDKGTLDWPKL